MPKLQKRVLEWRKKRGLSQEKLARRAHVSNNTIINIENGTNTNPRVITLKKIAEALDVPVEKLF